MSIFERKFLIPKASPAQVLDTINKALRDIGLKVTEEKVTEKGKTTILAAEGRIVPLIMKFLLTAIEAIAPPIEDYIRAAQRSGVHVVIQPAKNGITLSVYGIALNELSGKQDRYSKDEITEEVTDTLEAWEFEKKFIDKIKTKFPEIKEI
jgi:hypothetical protein